MSASQAEAHGLALSRASGNIEPYTALKIFILSSVSFECNTDWINVLSKIEYANAQEKPSTLMSRIIAACRSNPDNDQGTRDFREKIFMRLQPENIQQILKAQNFNSLKELENFTNRFHSQIVTSKLKYLADKVDELSTEICNVNRIIHLIMINANRRLIKHFLQVMHKRIVSMLLIVHENQTELFSKTDFVSITLSLVVIVVVV